jgi:hypothetical protein
MKPPACLPAGTPDHRQQYAELARRTALDVARVLGTGEIDGECYRGLPVGDRRVRDVLSEYLDTVEAQALKLFDRAVAARDLPAEHNVHQLRKSA